MAINPNTDFTAGQVLTADQQNRFPRGVMGYASNNSLGQNVTTIADITGLSVTFTAVTNRLYRVEGICIFDSTIAGDAVALIIRDGSNTIQNLAITTLEIATQDYTSYVSTVITGSGSTTMKLAAQRQLGTGTITALAGGVFPAHILVTDIGPT
jgi:hypothetical protein